MTLREKVEIQNYSLSEELISAISHGVGALLGVTALVLCIIKSAQNSGAIGVVSSCIYGTTLIILYTMSTMYHSLKVNDAKRVFQIIDHCSIYLLIAGTYTPYTLVSIGGGLGWTIFGIIWGMAAIGITFNSINIKKYRKISVFSYVIMGWIIVFAFKSLYLAIPKMGINLLVAGGILYTIGAIFYAVGKKVKYMHSIFHFFVLAGSILHFFSILLYVL